MKKIENQIQFCGRAKKENKFKSIVSTKTLYNYIDKGILKVKNITDKQVAYIEDWINLLPRKILNYSNPKEVFSMFF